MAKGKVTVNQINIIARNFESTLNFYRLAGLEIPEPMNQPEGALHAVTEKEQGIFLEIDNQHLASYYHSGVRKGGTETNYPIIGLTLENRDLVDSTYAKLMEAGFESRQPPYDAFWGSRYAIVADPEGNDVGLMSPPDEKRATWPPIPPPKG